MICNFFNKVIYLFPIGLVFLLLVSCTKNDSSFKDKILLLESSPQQILSHIDSVPVGTIANEKEATLFLLRSLSLYKLGVLDSLDKQKLLVCASVFNGIQPKEKELYTLILLADIYEQENNIKSEVDCIEKANNIAIKYDDVHWLFYLYNRLSGMYINQNDFIGFAKYQSIANQYVDQIDLCSVNIYTKILLAHNYTYTGQIDKAIQLLLSMEHEIRVADPSYADYRRAFGIAYALKKEWLNSISQIELALQFDRDSDYLFLYYTILTQCYHSLHDKEKVKYYQQKALLCIDDNAADFVASRFYELCADIAKEDNDTFKEVIYLRKVADIYCEIIKKQNTETLDEIIELYNTSYERKQHEEEVRLYHLIFIILLLLCVVALIVNYYYKKKKLYQFIELQNRISILEQIEHDSANLKNNTRNLILKDFEISRQIALLKHTQKKKYEVIEKNLTCFSSIIDTDKQLIRWDKFYDYINIYYDNFCKEISDKYPSLGEKEIQLCCMLKAGFRTNEIAAMWQQSIFSVHKYKTSIRKKINAPEGADIIEFLSTSIDLQV